MHRNFSLLALKPLLLPLIAAFFWTSSLVLFKLSLLKISLSTLIFVFFCAQAPLGYASLKKKRKVSLKSPHLLIHLLLSFVHVGLYFSLYGALSTLPLTNLSALYLCFPLWIPFVLKIWIGKRLNKKIIGGALIVLTGTFFTFNQKFGWGNGGILLASMAGLLKAVHWAGSRRLKMSEPPFRVWFYETAISIASTALLLLSSWTRLKPKVTGLILTATLLAWASQRALEHPKALQIPLYQKAALFNLAIFMGSLADVFIFHSTLPLRPFLCAILIYLGLFLIFFQKNILPNPVYEL